MSARRWHSRSTRVRRRHVGGWVDAEQSAPWVEERSPTCGRRPRRWQHSRPHAVDRGLLDGRCAVAKDWPDVRGERQGRILVRHLLSHTSGVSGWTSPSRTPTCTTPSPQPRGRDPGTCGRGTGSGYHLLITATHERDHDGLSPGLNQSASRTMRRDTRAAARTSHDRAEVRAVRADPRIILGRHEC